MIRIKKLYFILLILAWSNICHGVTGGHLYRYINVEGVVVIDDKIPPRYVSQGYEILSNTGQLLDTVEPSVPQNAVERALRKKALAARQREDRFILISYSSVAEIKAAMARKLGQLDREIQAIQSNIKRTKNRIIAEQQRAANYQRGGRQVPENVKVTLLELAGEVKKTERLLVRRRDDYSKVENLYQGYLVRYRELKDLSEGKTEAEKEKGETPDSNG